VGQGCAPAEAALLACGGTGLAGIGQLADITTGGRGPVPFAGWLALVAGRFGGELGAGGEVQFGEHVREVGLHGAAGDI